MLALQSQGLCLVSPIEATYTIAAQLQMMGSHMHRRRLPPCMQARLPPLDGIPSSGVALLSARAVLPGGYYLLLTTYILLSTYYRYLLTTHYLRRCASIRKESASRWLLLTTYYVHTTKYLPQVLTYHSLLEALRFYPQGQCLQVVTTYYLLLTYY